MAVTGKDLQVWMCNVVNFLMRSAYSLIKKHPFVSCPLLIFLVLYIFFPSFFWILLYSSAFLILAVSITRIYLRHRNAKNFRTDEKNSDAESSRKNGFARNDAIGVRNEKSFTRARSVRRRKPRETSRDSSVHTSEDEKNTVFLSAFNNDMVDKSALTEEKPKEILEIGVDSVISHAECSSSNDSLGLTPELCDTSCEGSRKFGGDGSGDIEVESSEGTDEEDEQEREENNKAVQWTEADQKNLMDLGFSEIERNKRLESLIARRRARKLLSLQVRRTPVNLDSVENLGPMTSLMIPRNNPFLHSQSTCNFSPMPGSAPSVLLPMHNPFDLPYDPHEEKPNLTGGSFHLEFNDITFCKQESSSLGASFPGKRKEDQHEASLSRDSTYKDGVSEGLQNSKVEGQLEEEEVDKIVEVESCQAPQSKLNIGTADKVIKEYIPDTKQGMDLVSNPQEGKSSEVQTKSVLTEHSNDKSSSASSSEDDVPIFRVDKDAVLKSLVSPLIRNMSMDREGSSQMGYVGNNHDPSVFTKNKMEEHFYNADKAMNHHTPMSSIASDLQVEVSEVSSPALTDDGSISCHDEEFSANKRDMESECSAGDENIRETLSQPFQIDENESRSKEIYDTNEDNTVESGFLRTKKSEDHVLSCELAEKVIEHATDSLSQSASEAELPDGTQDYSSSFHSNIEDNFQSFTSSDLSHALASDSLAFPVMDKVQHLKGNPMANTSQNDDFQEPEQPSYVSEKFKGELNTIYNVDDSKVLQKNDTEISTRETDDLADLLVRQGRMEPAKLSETSSSKSVDYTGSQLEKMDKHHNILEQVGKTADPKISEDIKEDLKDTKQDKMDEYMVIEGNDTLESIQVEEGERHIAELRSSGVQQNFSDHQVQALPPASVLEQVSIASGTYSPRSVLQPTISMDQSPLSNFGEDIHVEIHQLHPQRVENSLLDEARGEGLTSTMPQSTMLLMVDSTSHPLHEGNAEILQESSNLSTSTKETNSMGCVIEDMVHENGRGQKETNCIPEGSSEMSSSLLTAIISKQIEAPYIGQGSSNLSTSTKGDKSMESLSQNLIRENETRPNEMNVIHEGSSQRLSRPDSTAVLSKLIEEINSSVPNAGQESSDLLKSTKEANSIGSLRKQVIHEEEKKQNETEDVPEGSSNSFSYDSKAALSRPIEEVNSQLPVLASNEEANSMGSVSEQVILESKRRQNEIKDIPEGSSGRLSPESTVALSEGIGEISSDFPHIGQESSNLLASTKEANSVRFINNLIIHENEKEKNEAKDIPEGSSERLSSPDPTEAPSKPIVKISSRSLIMNDDRSDKLHKHKAENEAPPALLNPVEQVNKLNIPIIKTEEISQFQENSFSVAHKEEVLNSVEGEAQASTNATSSRDSQGTMDEKKGGFIKPSEGESRISITMQITEVEPSKSAEENNIPDNHISSTETEMPTNAPTEKSSEEVTSNPSTDKTFVSQIDGRSGDQTMKEAPKD